MSARIIAITNQKGGVGKTTTAINLGAALAEKDLRVLLIDLDPQANLTRGLGVAPTDVVSSMYDIMTDIHGEIAPVIMKTRWPHLDLVPSHIDLSGAEMEMTSMIGREIRLKRAMDDLPERYDFILIDCLPSLSILTINAMNAAREMLIPIQAHPFALEGVGKLFEVFELVKEQMNPELRVVGVLVTMFDGRTRVSREVAAKMSVDEHIAPHLMKTVIGVNIRIAESQGVGMPVIHFDPGCAGAKGYRRLARELLGEEERGAGESILRSRATAEDGSDSGGGEAGPGIGDAESGEGLRREAGEEKAEGLP